VPALNTTRSERLDGGLVVFGGFHYVPAQFTPARDAWRDDS